ncbi:MAG: hypothetical protein ACYTAO_16985 [Planctomycetota bacterium]|jgi:prophage maintenance system killer protein
MATLFVFLSRNGKWLPVDTQELYNFTVSVAQSPRTIKATEEFLQSHPVKLET